MMNKVQKSLAAFSLAVVANNAAAQESRNVLESADMPAVSVSGLFNRNYQVYNMEEMVLADRSSVRNRVFVDKVLDVACEWKEIGRRVPDKDAVFYTEHVENEVIGCISSPKLPEQWTSLAAKNNQAQEYFERNYMMRGMDPDSAKNAAKQMDEQMTQTTGTVGQSKSQPNMIAEMIAEGNPHAVPGMSIAHIWDLSTNRVCLITQESVTTKGTVDHRYQKWGCFQDAGQAYLGKIASGLSMQSL